MAFEKSNHNNLLKHQLIFFFFLFSFFLITHIIGVRRLPVDSEMAEIFLIIFNILCQTYN